MFSIFCRKELPQGVEIWTVQKVTHRSNMASTIRNKSQSVDKTVVQFILAQTASTNLRFSEGNYSYTIFNIKHATTS